MADQENVKTESGATLCLDDAVRRLTGAKERLVTARELAEAARKVSMFLDKAEMMSLEAVEEIVGQIRRS